ncbi:unnamed protein product, partial [Meganyctiphanes norvegica]
KNMDEMGSNENYDDEFECSECDFKCTSEIDIIQHSAIHQYSNNTNDPLSNISRYDTFENNDLGAYKHKVKIEPSLLKAEGEYTTKIIQESEIGNKIEKLEDIDIKEEIFHNVSSHQKNEYDNIHRGQDSLGHLNAKTEPSQNKMGLTNSSKVPSTHKRSYTSKKTPTRVRTNSEVEVDNTGIYIPPGWKRKVFMRSSLTKGLITYDCYYYTESGKNVRSKKDAYEYAAKNHLTGIDFAKLNFSVSQISIKTDQTTFEVVLDNSNIYIPEGWQRKVCMTTISNGQKKYHINYLNPEGENFGCKSEIYKYLSHPD